MGSTEDSCGSSTPPEGEKQFGVTKPISMAGPGEIDHQRTSDLEKYLVDAGLYESEEEVAKRLEVLDEIDQIVKGWVKQLTRQRGYTDQMVEEANAVLYTFGSYRLGAHVFSTSAGATTYRWRIGSDYDLRTAFSYCVLLVKASRHKRRHERWDATDIGPVRNQVERPYPKAGCVLIRREPPRKIAPKQVVSAD